MAREIKIIINGPSIKIEDSEHSDLEISFTQNRAVDEIVASIDRAIVLSQTESHE